MTFDDIDGNSDGVIDRTEWQSAQKQMAVSNLAKAPLPFWYLYQCSSVTDTHRLYVSTPFSIDTYP